MIKIDFELSSIAFHSEGKIPDIYTCKGKKISPPLSWKNIPKGTKSFALIMDDLDTPIGILNHWILYNIPPDKTELPEDIPHQEQLFNGIIQGKNSMKKNKYLAPCPPFGNHRYLFKIYALDIMLKIIPKMNKKRLLKSIKGHILKDSLLIGKYSKK